MNYKESQQPVWKQLFQLHKLSKKLFYFLIFIFAIELFSIFFMPYLLSSTDYLSLFLKKEAKEATVRFFRNENSVIPDKMLGWVNKKNFKRKNWVIDEHGSRATHEFTEKPSKNIRALFLGSSMINGSSHVTNNETISAYLENNNIESLNFATMLYTLDQVFLMYKEYLTKYNSNIIIVGIDNDPVSGLKNIYIPFISPEEINMPYMKPRYKLVGDKLELIKFNLDDFKMILNDDSIVEGLKDKDGFYYVFDLYKHFGITPIASGFLYIYKKISNLEKYLKEDLTDNALLFSIMDKMVREAEENNAHVIFITLADSVIYDKDNIRNRLTDYYAIRKDLMLKKDYNILDSRELFRNSGYDIDDLYADDGVHLTKKSNKLIAEKLKSIIHKLIEKNIIN